MTTVQRLQAYEATVRIAEALRERLRRRAVERRIELYQRPGPMRPQERV